MEIEPILKLMPDHANTVQTLYYKKSEREKTMELTFSRLTRISIAGLTCCMVVFILFSLVTTANAQTKIIPLWPGIAPGSENWTQKEVWYSNDWDQKKMVRNVTEPALTAFIPESGKSQRYGGNHLSRRWISFSLVGK